MTLYNNKTFRIADIETRQGTIKAANLTVITEGTLLSLDETDSTYVVWTDAGRKPVAIANRTFTMGSAGTSIEDIVVTGKVGSDMLIYPAGLTIVSVPLNSDNVSKEVYIPVENLAANADITARTEFVAFKACVIEEIGILTQAASVGVDDSNTAVIAITDTAGNSIVSKTYNTATQPPNSTYGSLGALSATHKILTAGELVKMAVTTGTTADLPAFFLVIKYKETIPQTKDIRLLLRETNIEAITTLENRY